MNFNEQSFLCHYGIKGMKWGIRRYQNPDGSLTADGLLRYRQGKLTASKSQKKKTLEKIRNRSSKEDVINLLKERRDLDAPLADYKKALQERRIEKLLIDIGDPEQSVENLINAVKKESAAKQRLVNALEPNRVFVSNPDRQDILSFIDAIAGTGVLNEYVDNLPPIKLDKKLTDRIKQKKL